MKYPPGHMDLPEIITQERVGPIGSGAQAALAAALLRRGALLLRGFGGPRVEDFQALLSALEVRTSSYDEGLSTRPEVAPRIYPTTTWPSTEVIHLHNELCHTASPPRTLYFFCCAPAETGGRTPLTDSRAILDQLDPEVLEVFAGRRIKYLTNLRSADSMKPLGRPWQEVYGTSDRAAIEAALRRDGTDFEWADDGTLATWRLGPVTVQHPETGDAVWFNQAALWHVTNLGRRGARLRRVFGERGVPTNAFFEDGAPIPDAALQHVRTRMWAAASRPAWRAGDLMIVDNHRVAHGREAFTGGRRILIAFSRE